MIVDYPPNSRLRPIGADNVVGEQLRCTMLPERFRSRHCIHREAKQTDAFELSEFAVSVSGVRSG